MESSSWTSILAIIGATTGVASLVWQFVHFALSGGRADVQMSIGAVLRGPDVKTLLGEPDVDEQTVTGTDSVILRGSYTGSGTTLRISDYAMSDLGDGAILARVRNTGRMPVQIQEVSVRVSREKWTTYVAGFKSGPALPHTIEAGASETWTFGTDPILAVAEGNSSGELKGDATADVHVQLGNGKVRLSRQSYVV